MYCLKRPFWFLIPIPLTCVPYAPFDNKSALVQLIDWCRTDHYISWWKAKFSYMSITRPRCISVPLPWRHNGHDSVSYHQPHHCLLNRLCGCRSKETSKLRVTGLCAGNSPGTGAFPAQMASNAENVSIWWRHHANMIYRTKWSLDIAMIYQVSRQFHTTYFGISWCLSSRTHTHTHKLYSSPSWWTPMIQRR